MAIILYDLCGRDPDLRFSPHCWRAKMALAHKGLTFETVPTPFTQVPQIESGVSKTVPVINDSGKVVHDSFDIALYLDTAYPDAPTLFGDEAAVAAARFLESWAFSSVHSIIMRMMVKDIHDSIAPADQAYFRPSREARLGRALEEHQTGVEANAEAFRAALEPARRTLARHAWLGGASPRFADYILFGSLMWLRSIQGRLPLLPDDAVLSWFERCLDLHGGLARGAPTARAA
jgi:glutathione S-transferase